MPIGGIIIKKNITKRDIGDFKSLNLPINQKNIPMTTKIQTSKDSNLMSNDIVVILSDK